MSIEDTFDEDETEWYDQVDINSIGLVGYNYPMSTNDIVYNKVETFDILDEATVQQSTCQTLFKLEDPCKFQMYDLPGAQMDGGAKFTLTNNIYLLKDVW